MYESKVQQAIDLILNILKNEKAPLDIDECCKRIIEDDNYKIPQLILHYALWKLIAEKKIELDQKARVSLKKPPPQ